MSQSGYRSQQSQRAASRVSQKPVSTTRQTPSRLSKASQQSYAMSRTPSADRELLGTLTKSPPPRDDEEEDDDDTPSPDPRTESLHSQGRRSSRLNMDPDGGKDKVVTLDGNKAASRTSKVNGGSRQQGTVAGRAESTVRLTGVASGTKEGNVSRVGSRVDSSRAGSREDDSRAASKQGGTTGRADSTNKHSGTNENDWQSNKSVIQCNEYMLKYEVLTDVVFVVGDSREEVRAHKYVLMSRSPVLFKSLAKQLNNTGLRIAVPDMNVDVFRELLQYMYTDEFDMDTANVPLMLFAAKKFQLKGLLSLCFRHLNSELDDDTVCNIMEQAHKYNENVLFEKCKRHIFMNGDAVLKNGTFGDLCADCVTQIVKSDELHADEDHVFEACMTWAVAETKRTKKPATDEAKREVLGNILYLIRFPIMDVTYFTQKVSLSKVLSHDETLSMFQYFHGEIQQLPNRFSRNPRNRTARNFKDNELSKPIMLQEPNKSDMLRMIRFPTSDGYWKQNGPPDAISFRVSEPIVLYGIEVYGAASGQETYSVQLFVYDDITRDEVRRNEASIFTSTVKDAYDVFFAKPIRIPARRVFTIMVIMKGNATRKGIDGESTLVKDGVTIEFMESSRSSNGTGISVGQIPGLLFNRTD